MSPISKIRKRDGRIVDFDKSKIATAIYKASAATNEPNKKLANELANEVVDTLKKECEPDIIPGVEDIQDIVERTLIQANLSKIAKAYIVYRQKRAELREIKKILGLQNELKLTVNAAKVLQRRYLLKNDKGEVVESPKELFVRVAGVIAESDKKYNPNVDLKSLQKTFYQMMANFEFLPNSPTLMNAGTDIGQLSACFVLPVGDSIEEIFDAVKHMALIHKSGGGTGFSFSKIRPKGDIVKTTKGVASGPLSFMRVFDMATEVIKQGGKRRGANMGILCVDHPDILDFIASKEEEGRFSNFNLSVGVTDQFMEAVKTNSEYELVNPRNQEVVRKLRAKHVFDQITFAAWKTGDPGIIFIDEINRRNQTPELGKIESTNPCGEQMLLSYESCNLGSINLSKMVMDNKVSWEKLKKTVQAAVHFLDNVIDANKFPLPEIEKMTKGNRKIGLGVMGFAEMLIQLGIPYSSEKALEIGTKIMKFILEEARNKSTELGKERGSFPNFKGSVWDKLGFEAMRNATTTTIAPTGTISIIAGTSSGIEPLFAVSFMRNVMEGVKLFESNPFFEQIAKKRGFYSEELTAKIAHLGSIQDIEEIPPDVKTFFVTAFDIPPEHHVKMQASFQKYTDNAVSKTVNLPESASQDDIKKIFMLAYELKCKGITIYRYGSKKEQVLYLSEPPNLTKEPCFIVADSEFSGECRDCMV
ncbi:vitamin B12-dependent ribonucleotide reductase [Candidatus Oleimmundimicrobium sp.]|uniref:vitamin B12-dependent ribonucleotide reductase n=1 Tax=Candidatus Oleimmundimicrobium sp. TaxID=3060597 RepID=UPI00271F320A|nr:vitamin B12-dependent ribonucleotide reductase [Candidatus Oleimmundimicrobium sp.]MDO8885670.1 vitamin B12-dependent ribonucleotide reductase [Candidatus Oleimmundimicrobium sp.]